MKKRKDGRYVKVMTYTRPDGTEYKKYFYGFSPNEVFKQVAAYEIKEEQGELFTTVAENWREEHYKTIEYNTQQGYEKSYKQANSYFKDVYIKDITLQHCQKYVNNFVSKKYAAKTITHHLSVLKLIFNFAVLGGYISSNPATLVTVPRGLPKTKRTPPSKEDIEIIKKNVNLPFGLFPFLILYTGMRKGEALALQFKDFDYENNLITVSKSCYFEGNKPHIKIPKTEAGTRVVPFLSPSFPFKSSIA